MKVVGLGEDESPEGVLDVVVAIDGPAGSGKSTVARRVAELAGLRYLDTGATYRALTLALLRREVRSPEVNGAVSAVAAVPAVRELLVALQRSLVGLGGIVVEGRDIGTVVWPGADVKVFLTASDDERARRRTSDHSGGGESASSLARRDRLDSGRAASPTRPAEDAVVMDSTDRAVGQVVDEILRLVEAARARRPR